MRATKFHGRHETTDRDCDHPDCDERGEFRAPGGRGASFDGPGEYRWMCLDHVREFNAGYDWFDGMTADEVFEAQRPGAGWRTEQPAFDPTAAVDGMPRWADYADPLDAIGARANGIRSRARREAGLAMDGRFSREEAAAIEVLGLGSDIDRRKLRGRYSELVRRYHPDRNGGDRRYEERLTRTVQAYQLLRKSAALK